MKETLLREKGETQCWVREKREYINFLGKRILNGNDIIHAGSEERVRIEGMAQMKGKRDVGKGRKRDVGGNHSIVFS